jgi:multidrug efflux pump subunit AcrB
MAAFLPLMLLPGIVGKFMFVIPFVVTVGLSVSLLEAFWILPAHVIVLNPQGLNRNQSHWRNRWTQKVRISYGKALAYVLRRPKRFMSAGIAAFLLAVLAVSLGAVRVEFFTFDPFRLFYINVDMPSDTTLSETLKQTELVEQEVRKYLHPDEIRSVVSIAGLKFTDSDRMFADQYGQIQVSLLPRTRTGRPVGLIVNEMRAAITALPGNAEISFFEVSGGPPVAAPVNVNVRSTQFDELRRATNTIKKLVAAIPGAKDIVDNDIPGRPELTLSLDYRAIRQAGLNPGVLARLLRLHLDGEVVAFIRDKGEKVELRVKGPTRNVNDVNRVLDDPIALPQGGTTTFRALSTTTVQRTSGTIRHYNFRRSITVQAELDSLQMDSVSANKLLVKAWDEVKQEYPNTDLDFSGAFDDIQESLDAMWGLALLGLGLIYLILATQFRSYFQPLLILVTVPMAFTGVVAGLLITGNPLSLYTLYGVIALTGIAVNSAIVLIDAANTRIASGMRPLHATVYAGRRRVIPILMTSLTTIAGLFSLAVGLGGKSLLWGPVATSIVAGLLVATVLTLFLVPVLYRIFMRGHGITVDSADATEPLK